MCELDRQIELQTIITRGVRQATGMHERLALPLVDAIMAELQRHYGGERYYIPAPGRVDRDQSIRDAIALGSSVSDVCKAKGVSKATVYRALKDQPPSD